MNLRQVLRRISESAPSDWQLIFRPTFRHRFNEILTAGGEVAALDQDEHAVMFTLRADIEISMAYGMVEQGAVPLDSDNPFAKENARTVFLDIFYQGRMVHREVILKVDRNRCLLPLPTSWEQPVMVPLGQANLVRLIHSLAGPPTDFESYFEQAGMRHADVPWP